MVGSRRQYSIFLILVTYIVHWTANVLTPTSCPNSDIKDPYTGSVIAKTLALCHDVSTRKMEQTFDTKEEAAAFIKDCPPGVCVDIKFEEVHQ